jgi:hypothetical protein
MVDFFVWLPFGVVGIAIMVFLAIVRWPDEIEPRAEARAEARRDPMIDVGSVRLASIGHTDHGVVIDGLVDRLCPLGSVGAPVTLVVADFGVDDAVYAVLERWVAADSVVDLEVPVSSSLEHVVDVRNGEAEMRLPILGLSS